MSVFCPACSKKTYNEERCDFCHYQIKTTSRESSRVFSSCKGVLSNPFHIGAFVAIFIIAASLSYLAISHYQEKRAGEKLMEAFIGTSDPDKMIEHYKKSMMDLNAIVNKSQREAEEKMRGIFGNTAR